MRWRGWGRGLSRGLTPGFSCSLGPACWLWDYLRRSGQVSGLTPLRFWWPERVLTIRLGFRRGSCCL